MTHCPHCNRDRETYLATENGQRLCVFCGNNLNQPPKPAYYGIGHCRHCNDTTNWSRITNARCCTICGNNIDMNHPPPPSDLAYPVERRFREIAREEALILQRAQIEHETRKRADEHAKLLHDWEARLLSQQAACSTPEPDAPEPAASHAKFPSGISSFSDRVLADEIWTRLTRKKK